MVFSNTPKEEEEMMRKTLWLVVACLLALVIVSVSNVSALELKKIKYTEWLVSMTAKLSTLEGDYIGAYAGGDAILDIGDPADGVYMRAVPLVNSFTGWSLGSEGEVALYTGYTYNPTKNRLKSTYGYVAIDDPVIGLYEYDGELICKITFSSSKAFTGSIVIVDDVGSVRLVISLKGKKLGKWTGPL